MRALPSNIDILRRKYLSEVISYDVSSIVVAYLHERVTYYLSSEEFDFTKASTIKLEAISDNSIISPPEPPVQLDFKCIAGPCVFPDETIIYGTSCGVYAQHPSHVFSSQISSLRISDLEPSLSHPRKVVAKAKQLNEDLIIKFEQCERTHISCSVSKAASLSILCNPLFRDKYGSFMQADNILYIIGEEKRFSINVIGKLDVIVAMGDVYYLFYRNCLVQRMWFVDGSFQLGPAVHVKLTRSMHSYSVPGGVWITAPGTIAFLTRTHLFIYNSNSEFVRGECPRMLSYSRIDVVM